MKRIFVVLAATSLLSVQLTSATDAQAPQARPDSNQVEVMFLDTRALPALSMRFRVRDAAGRYVAGLASRDVQLSAGQAALPIQSLRTVTGGDAPLDIVLVVDESGSVASVLPALRLGARTIVERLGAGVPLGIVIAGERPRWAQRVTSNIDSAIRGIPARASAQRTALWDAVAFAAVQDSGGRSHRRLLVVLSDGRDNASSLTSVAVADSLRSMQTPVFIIAAGRTVDTTALRSLAVSTGGGLALADGGSLQTAIRAIGDAMAGEHVLRTLVPDSLLGRWETMRLTIATSDGPASASTWERRMLFDGGIVGRASAPTRSIISTTPLALVLVASLMSLLGFAAATALLSPKHPRRPAIRGTASGLGLAIGVLAWAFHVW